MAHRTVRPRKPRKRGPSLGPKRQTRTLRAPPGAAAIAWSRLAVREPVDLSDMWQRFAAWQREQPQREAELEARRQAGWRAWLERLDVGIPYVYEVTPCVWRKEP